MEIRKSNHISPARIRYKKKEGGGSLIVPVSIGKISEIYESFIIRGSQTRNTKCENKRLKKRVIIELQSKKISFLIVPSCKVSFRR